MKRADNATRKRILYNWLVDGMRGGEIGSMKEWNESFKDG